LPSARREDVSVSEGSGPRRRSLAEKLEHLFKTVHPASRGEYSFEEVAASIRERGGPTISASYIWQLRRGLRDNPTVKHLEALADFFGVSAAYFLDDEAAERIEAELTMLAALRDSSVRRVAMRSQGLSRRSLAAISEIVEQARRVEGLRNGDTERSKEGGPQGGEG
jgi:transcriptional regulator with XRE-family HTH domain